MNLRKEGPHLKGEIISPDLLDNVIGIRIRRLQSLFGSHWQGWFRTRGLSLTPVQGGVLLVIHRHSDISQVALARRLRIEPPTLIQSLTPLIKQKLVERERCADDARVYKLRLSQAGRDAAAVVNAATPEHEADLLRGLTDQERQQFLTLLDKAIAGAEVAMAGKGVATTPDDDR